jgi:hypothetical protein
MYELQEETRFEEEPSQEFRVGNYPPEYESPKVKEKRPYGLAYVKAMYETCMRSGNRFLYDDSDYEALMEVAQGRQSVDGIKKLFGHFRDPNGDNTDDDGSSNLAYIDVQVLNLAPKYINRAVAKMQKYTYDLEVNAVDIVSVDEKQDYAAGIQAFYRLKKWMTDMGFDPKQMFPDLDVDSLPQYPDEMLYDIAVNPKIKKEISAEIGLKLLHYVNKFAQVMREVDWDYAVHGKGHIHCYNDENGVPRVDRVNPKYVIGSYVDNEDYKKQENAGFFDFITVNTLRKEMLADGYDEDFIQRTAHRYSNANAIGNRINTTSNWNQYDGLQYIPVLRFYFKSEDNKNYKVKRNKFGTPIMFEQGFDYRSEAESDEQAKLHEEQRIVKNAYTSVYGGMWILDSDVVVGYGRKKLPRLNLVNAILPIISFAPNMKEGRVVSFLSQMLEPLFMINVVHNKIKEVLAKGWIGVRQIDMDALENVAMGKGGNVWTPREIYKHLLRTNTLITRGTRNKHDQKVNDSISVNPSGIQMEDYYQAFSQYVSVLENMVSTPVAAAASVPDRLSATAAKQSAQTADTDMEYLFNGHEYMYYQGSHYLLLLLQESKRDGNKIAGFIPAMGKVNSGYYEASDELAYCELGLMMNRAPTDEQWLAFFNLMGEAFAQDKISVSDVAFLMDEKNLKQAYQMMAIRERQYKREKQAEAQFNNKLAMDANNSAAEAKLQGEVAKEQEKGRVQMQVETLKGQIQERIMQQEKQFEAQIAGVDLQVKERIKLEEGKTSLLKEAMRSNAERYKSDNKVSETVMDTMQKADSDHKKLMAPKPKAA